MAGHGFSCLLRWCVLRPNVFAHRGDREQHAHTYAEEKAHLASCLWMCACVWKRKEAVFSSRFTPPSCGVMATGTWEPRALKKRKEEFNTGSRPATFNAFHFCHRRQIDAEEARKAEAAKALEATEFKGAADLEDLEDEADGASSAERHALTRAGRPAPLALLPPSAAPATAAPGSSSKTPTETRLQKARQGLQTHQVECQI